MRTHRQLCILNFVGMLCAVSGSCSMAIVWYYWHNTLNTCGDPNNDCGCVLYGTWGFVEFSGGDYHNCSFVTFAPLPLVLWSFLVGIYHGFHDRSSKESRRILLTNKPYIQRELNPQRVAKIFAVCSSVVSIASAIVIFAAGIVLTDGYFKTCKEYKKSIIDELDANGNLAILILDRMSCGAAFDFLDYLQPDPEYLDYRYRRGNWVINTDLSLKFALFSIWMTFSLYTILSILYIISSRKPKISPKILNTEL